jgi:hypothetical protein
MGAGFRAIFTIFFLFLLAPGIASRAQPDSFGSATRLEQPRSALRGPRLGLVKSYFDVDLKMTDPLGNSLSATDDAKQKYGIGLGYVYIPERSPGGSLRLLYTEFEKHRGKEVVSLRLEANATYGVNEDFYGFAGFNVQKFTSGFLKEYRTRPGFQLGAGAQLSPNLGVDMAYVVTNNHIYIEGIEATLSMRGPELSLHGTF